MSTILEEIVASHRARAALDRRRESELRAGVARLGATRGFAESLRHRHREGGEIAVIAEVKRRSPSKGDLAPGLDPGMLATEYARGGASCLSVLTDEDYFGGSAADLASARAAVGLPVLRKDFTVCAADCFDARAMGADAILLIVAALSDAELSGLSSLADELGLDALVEVHDEAECERALRGGARLIGVNQRDLRTFAVDTGRAERLAKELPAEVVRVAESGVRDAQDLVRLEAAGYDAVLVGEALVTAGDPAGALAALRGADLSTAAGVAPTPS